GGHLLLLQTPEKLAHKQQELNMQRKYHVLPLTALASLAISMAAVAQQPTDQTNPPATPSAETPAPSGATEETPAEPRKKAEEEIVVTGSRVRRKDLTTPAPVTVISREQMITSGRVSLGDFLQTLPEQGNAINTGVNNGGDGSTRVSLRGIGDPGHRGGYRQAALPRRVLRSAEDHGGRPRLLQGPVRLRRRGRRVHHRQLAHAGRPSPR